jgi:hypothetical protein
MKAFLGYGNPKGRWWFIGKEEGGGNSMEEVQARIEQWHQRQQHNAENLQTFSRAVGHGLNRWFCPDLGPPIQRTWGPLIRAMLNAMEHQPPEDAQITDYQEHNWGSNAGNTFLSEVLPLPASRGHWDYPCRSWWLNEDVPDFAQSRKAAFAASNAARGAIIGQFVQENRAQTKVIIVYGRSPHHQWLFNTLLPQPHPLLNFINHAQYGPPINIAINIPNNANVMLVHTAHPTANGATNEYWNLVGQTIAQLAHDNHFNLGNP